MSAGQVRAMSGSCQGTARLRGTVPF